MAIKNEDIGKLKSGSYIVFNGKACKIVDMQRSAPGKHGHAKYRVSAIDIITGQKIVKVLGGHHSVEVPIIEKKVGQILSISGKAAQVMDMESYETFDAEIDPEADGVEEGKEVLYWDILGRRIIKGKR